MAAVYLALWIILNGRVTPEILIFGVIFSAGAAALTERLGGRRLKDEKQFFIRLPFLLRYFAVLFLEIIKAACAVIGLTWSGKKPEPALVEFHSGLRGNWRNVLLAESITLTPGTYTVFQEGDYFVVHSLCPAYAQGIEDSVFVKLLKKDMGADA